MVPLGGGAVGGAWGAVRLCRLGARACACACALGEDAIRLCTNACAFFSSMLNFNKKFKRRVKEALASVGRMPPQKQEKSIV